MISSTIQVGNPSYFAKILCSLPAPPSRFGRPFHSFPMLEVKSAVKFRCWLTNAAMQAGSCWCLMHLKWFRLSAVNSIMAQNSVFCSPFHVGSQLRHVGSTWHRKYRPQPGFATQRQEQDSVDRIRKALEEARRWAIGWWTHKWKGNWDLAKDLFAGGGVVFFGCWKYHRSNVLSKNYNLHHMWGVFLLFFIRDLPLAPFRSNQLFFTEYSTNQKPARLKQLVIFEMIFFLSNTLGKCLGKKRRGCKMASLRWELGRFCCCELRQRLICCYNFKKQWKLTLQAINRTRSSRNPWPDIIGFQAWNTWETALDWPSEGKGGLMLAIEVACCGHM